jgi:hypothetical protein
VLTPKHTFFENLDRRPFQKKVVSFAESEKKISTTTPTFNFQEATYEDNPRVAHDKLSKTHTELVNTFLALPHESQFNEMETLINLSTFVLKFAGQVAQFRDVCEEEGFTDCAEGIDRIYREICTRTGELRMPFFESFYQELLDAVTHHDDPAPNLEDDDAIQSDGSDSSEGEMDEVMGPHREVQFHIPPPPAKEDIVSRLAKFIPEIDTNYGFYTIQVGDKSESIWILNADIPDNFLCMITGGIMHEPMTATCQVEDKHVFNVDKENAQYVTQCMCCSYPKPVEIVENTPLKDIIQKWFFQQIEAQKGEEASMDSLEEID